LPKTEPARRNSVSPRNWVSATPQRLVIGPPERLPLKLGQNVIAASADGQVIAQSMWTGYGEQDYAGGWILHPSRSEPRQVDPGASVGACSVSPDGRWISFLVGNGQGARIKVYESSICKCVFQTPLAEPPPVYCRFSPDGFWLLTQEADGGHVYAVDTWVPGHSLGPGRPWDATSDLVVMGESNGIYRLVELATGRELARLEDPEQVSGAAGFTPDGSKLVVTAKYGLRVWDLRLIRQELKHLGLDWDGPAYFAGQDSGLDTKPSQAGKPDLKVEVELGLLDSERIKVLNDQLAGHIREGQWKEATADFAQLTKLDPTEHSYWYESAPLYLQLGDQEGYRRICGAMLARFGNTDNRQIAERAAKTCLLAPDAVSDLGPVLKLADLAVTGITEQTGYYRWFVLAKGMAEYRAGHYAAAIDWLNRVSPQIDGERRDATVFAVLAMANHRLASAQGADATRLDKEARKALQHAKAILSEKMPNPKAGRPFTAYFHDWLRPLILCREAEALLGIKDEKTQPINTNDTKVKP
jgi:hypothetical protein